MSVLGAREFRAVIRSGTGAFNLHCRRCKTVEELPKGKLPHDAAIGHAQWFHQGPVRIPQGWQRTKRGDYR